MPMMTIVTLADEDGDEFPIALPGDWSDSPKAAEAEARVRMDEIKATYGRGPEGYLSLVGMEFPGNG